MWQGLRTDRQVETVQDGDIACGVSKPNVLKMNPDTHVIFAKVAIVEGKKLPVVVVLFSHLNDSFCGNRRLCDVSGLSVKLEC